MARSSTTLALGSMRLPDGGEQDNLLLAAVVFLVHSHLVQKSIHGAFLARSKLDNPLVMEGSG